MKILIKNGRVISPENKINDIIDILIEDDKIKEMGKPLECKADRVIDASDLIVAPGFIDAHCHLRDPGYEYKEDIITGTKSAANGGFTSVACMPNTNPVIDNKSIVTYIINKAKEMGYVNVFPIGAVSKGLEGKELSEMGDMKKAGIVAVSDDGRPVVSAALMKKALIYANDFNLKVISHCEDLDLVDGGSMNEGYQSTTMGLRGIPAAAEEVMIARDVILSQYTDLPVHIAHVSTKAGIEIIRTAKKNGVKVTAETCPHYFTLTEEACSEYNTNAKMNPPLRTKKDVEAVKQGLKDGTIDIIVTDHAPHHIDEKNVEFDIALNGIVGFETALPLAITYLIKKEILTFEELVSKMSVLPAKILGIDKGIIKVGADADITIINPDKEIIIDENIKSKSKNTPFIGWKLQGTAAYTIVGGKVVLDNGIIKEMQ